MIELTIIIIVGVVMIFLYPVALLLNWLYKKGGY